MALGWRGSYVRYREFFLNIVNLYKRRADLRAFIEVILSISTVTVFLLFALKPTALTIIDLVKEINQKKETVAALNKKITDLQTAQNLFSQNQEQIANLEIAVGSKPQPDVISKQLQGLAGKDQVTVSGFSIGQLTLAGREVKTSKKSSEVKPLPESAREMVVTTNIQGDFAGIVNFMKDLENLRMTLKIDGLGINTSEINGTKILIAIISGRVPFIGTN